MQLIAVLSIQFATEKNFQDLFKRSTRNTKSNFVNSLWRKMKFAWLKLWLCSFRIGWKEVQQLEKKKLNNPARMKICVVFLGAITASRRGSVFSDSAKPVNFRLRSPFYLSSLAFIQWQGVLYWNVITTMSLPQAIWSFCLPFSAWWNSLGNVKPYLKKQIYA